jgi:hypothetical protein
MRKLLLMGILCLVSFAATAQQESASFTFAQTSQQGDVPSWLTDTGQTLTVLGSEYPVFKNAKCGYAVRLRGKYFVYVQDLNGSGETLPDGTPIYTTCKGTPYIFVMGASGPYAKYGQRK